MGALTCNRINCGNIMCDTYIQSVGYICESCQTEFKEYLNKNYLKPKNDWEITTILREFMDTTKNGIEKDNNLIDEFFKSYTK